MRQRPDKERAAKLVKIMHDDVLESLAYNKISRYSFDNFCKEHNLYSDEDLHRAADVVIHCPFQEGDSTPSCSINEQRGVYHCFACGAHGGFVDFVVDYERTVEGSNITWYQKLDQMVKQDAILAAKAGFGTIYHDDRQTLDEVIREKKPKLSLIRSGRPSTYLELATKMQQRGCDISTIKYMILQMQYGISAEDIYSKLFDDNTEAVYTNSTSTGAFVTEQLDIKDLEVNDE